MNQGSARVGGEKVRGQDQSDERDKIEDGGEDFVLSRPKDIENCKTCVFQGHKTKLMCICVNFFVWYPVDSILYQSLLISCLLLTYYIADYVLNKAEFKSKWKLQVHINLIFVRLKYMHYLQNSV